MLGVSRVSVVSGVVCPACFAWVLACECDWVARALLVLRLMGVWVVVVCSACVGFVRLPERPV